MNEPPVDTRKLYFHARKYRKRLYIDPEPRARVGMLGAMQQKTVESAKALAADIKRHPIAQPSRKLSIPLQAPLFKTGGNRTW